MMGRDCFIFPGRFQPPHNDHVVAIRRALPICGDFLFLGLIVHAPTSSAASSAFEHEARLQNAPERNPFSFFHRAQFMEAILSAELTAEERSRIRTIALPRPEVAWDWICAVFPDGRRHWVVPDCGESFDDMKAEFFRAKGEHVVRVNYTPTTDGRRVRELIARRSPEIARHVPAAVVQSLIASGLIDPEATP